MVSAQTATRYIDLLVDLLLVRRLRPFHKNPGKRLVKSPKLYVRDSGLVYALLGIPDHNALAGHPVVGASWEGFVIENLLSAAPAGTAASFYRRSAGAEIDLVLEFPDGRCWAVEIKRGLAPRLEKGFHFAHADLKPRRSFVVYSGKDRYPLAEGVESVSLAELSAIVCRRKGLTSPAVFNRTCSSPSGIPLFSPPRAARPDHGSASCTLVRAVS